MLKFETLFVNKEKAESNLMDKIMSVMTGGPYKFQSFLKIFKFHSQTKSLSCPFLAIL